MRKQQWADKPWIYLDWSVGKGLLKNYVDSLSEKGIRSNFYVSFLEIYLKNNLILENRRR